MSDVKCRDMERELLTLGILDGTIDRPTAADLVRCIDKLEQRIEVLERKLNHKSIKIADESLKNGGTE